ncbi:MAG: PAS domain S-box protein [Promethearchaeota archaeon]
MLVTKNDLNTKEEDQDRYEFLVNSIMDIIIEIDLEMKITYINSKVYDITGYHPEEVMGSSIFDYAHPDDIPPLKKCVEEGIKTRKTVTMEFRLKHKKGHYIRVSMKGTMARLEDKLIPVAVLRDLTGQKKSENELREFKEKYNSLIKNTSDIIAEVDMKGVVTYMSPQVYEVTGLKPEEFLGKKWYSYATSDISPIKKMLHPSQTVDEIQFEYETIHERNQCQVWLEVRGKRFTNDQGQKKDLIIARDITEKKKAEEKLKEALKKENFYKNLFTHDINNILHIIQTSLSLFTLFKNDPTKSDELDNLVKILKEQVVRGSLLVSNVRRLSEIETQFFTPESVDVCDALRNAIKFVKEGFQNTKIDINVNFEGNLFFVQANELLVNVFENILINAAKYNDNPLIEISINISTSKVDKRDYVKIEFLDNGVGVPDDKKELIFQETSRSEKGGKGLGFGLTLVRKIVENYNGKVWVEDRVKGKPSKGANFVVLVPQAI